MDITAAGFLETYMAMRRLSDEDPDEADEGLVLDDDTLEDDDELEDENMTKPDTEEDEEEEEEM